MKRNPFIKSCKVKACDVNEERQNKKNAKSDIILIKLFIDTLQHITVPIHASTKQSKVIAKVVKCRNIDTAKVKCILYFEDRQLTDEDPLHQIIAKDHTNGAYHFQQYQMRYEMIKCAGRHIR